MIFSLKDFLVNNINVIQIKDGKPQKATIYTQYEAFEEYCKINKLDVKNPASLKEFNSEIRIYCGGK